MNDTPGPRNLRELKIDFGKHILWVYLVQESKTGDHVGIIEGIDDDTFIGFAERARAEQADTIRTICNALEQALHVTRSAPYDAAYHSTSRAIGGVAGDTDDRLSSACMPYFRQLIVAAPQSVAALIQIVELIVEFGNET